MNVKLEERLDALFKLPIEEFTAARNALASELKKSGRSSDAEEVKSLAKPPISAWVVNQLYWKHRETIDNLIAVGERLRQAHASQIAGKSGAVRGPLNARRDAVSGLLRLAGTLLTEAGHNPTPSTMRRVTTTLEALSAYSEFPAGSAGRLANDLNPPGFESIAGLISSNGPAESQNQARHSSARAASSVIESKSKDGKTARTASAKTALEEAELELRDAKEKARETLAILKEFTSQATQIEKVRREAEAQLKKASAAAEQAHRRLQGLSADADAAKKAVEDAERSVQVARRKLQRDR